MVQKAAGRPFCRGRFHGPLKIALWQVVLKRLLAATNPRMPFYGKEKNGQRDKRRMWRQPAKKEMIEKEGKPMERAPHGPRKWQAFLPFYTPRVERTAKRMGIWYTGA